MSDMNQPNRAGGPREELLGRGAPSGSVRRPAVAGRFYPADPGECRREAASFLRAHAAAGMGLSLVGGIVPHAGWVCSGAIAGETVATLAENRRRYGATPEVVEARELGETERGGSGFGSTGA